MWSSLMSLDGWWEDHCGIICCMGRVVVPMGGLGGAEDGESEYERRAWATLARFQMALRLAMSEKKPPTSQMLMVMNTG